MGSSQRDARRAGRSDGETRGATPRPEGVAVWAEESEPGKAGAHGEGPQPVGSPSNPGTRMRTLGNAPVGCRGTVTGDEVSNRC